MKSTRCSARRWSALAALLLAGCGAEAPPLEQLPLRDTLRAEPDAVAALDDAARAELGERFEEAIDAPPAPVSRAGGERVPWPDVELREADAVLEDRGDDAAVLARLSAAGDTLRLDGWRPTGGELADAALPPREGAPADVTAVLEELALETRAGELVREIAGATNAERFVRVTGWPAGVVVHDGTAYVNAAWLVAMSPLSFDPSPTAAAPAVTAPPVEPLALAFNPYRLPASLAVCSDDVVRHCDCVGSGACAGDPPVDPRFSSAEEECAWVAADPLNPAVLCILWLMSIDAIADCMPDECQVGGLDDAVRVAQDPFCLEALDNCIQGREAEASSSGGCDSDCDEDCGTPDCNSPDCNSCDQSCDNCQESCDTCEGACNDTNDSCNESCDRNCSVAPPPRRREPAGTVLWLLVPLAYLFWRARRPA